jgi:RNA polymerase sigma factor (sigma-70 family)
MAVKDLRLTPEQAQLAQEYTPFAYWLVGKYYKRYKKFGYDAVYDYTMNALINTARNWDKDKGANFKTLLALAVKGNMQKVVRDANAKKRSGVTVSMDATHDEDEKLTLHDIVGDVDHHYIDLKEAISTLSEREKKAVYLSIVEGRAQTEIAEELGVSQMHTSRIIRRGLKKMRERV